MSGNARRLLGVDCDLTVCPSDDGWWDYLNCKVAPTDYQYKNAWGNEAPYNLAEIFPSVRYPFDYWRELEYDQFEPIEGSVEALEKLSEYFGIVFISQHKGQHSKSKYYWLQKNFPFNSGVMLTKEKWLMNDSVIGMIDDRLDHLAKFDENKRIQFETPYTQSVECSVNLSFNKWDDKIVKQICNEYL